jgi:hypothetical protein
MVCGEKADKGELEMVQCLKEVRAGRREGGGEGAMHMHACVVCGV